MRLALRQWWDKRPAPQIVNTLSAEITPRRLLIFTVICLLCLGTVMITSASMPYGEYINGQPLYFIKRHLIYLVVGGCALAASFLIPLR